MTWGYSLATLYRCGSTAPVSLPFLLGFESTEFVGDWIPMPAIKTSSVSTLNLHDYLLIVILAAWSTRLSPVSR